jgi:hypothetical protein
MNLPLNIELDLNVGMKYLFQRPRNSDLILKAWNDFTTCLCWRLFFAFTQNETSYNPDYEVTKVSKKKVKLPTLPYYLECSFLEGQLFVCNSS